jgi:hypothetical protein
MSFDLKHKFQTKQQNREERMKVDHHSQLKNLNI